MAPSNFPAIHGNSNIAFDVKQRPQPALPKSNFASDVWLSSGEGLDRWFANETTLTVKSFSPHRHLSRETSYFRNLFAVLKKVDVDLIDMERPFDHRRASAPIVESKTPATQEPEQLRNVIYKSRPASPAATVLQVWEGRVDSVDIEAKEMVTQLNDKSGKTDSHVAIISLEWVAEQDQDLVKPGAVFYLTQSKFIRNGTLKNEQELRFRRLPNWTARAVKEIYNEADRMLAAVRAK